MTKNLKITLFGTDGKRKNLPAKNITAVSWTEERYGGWADFNVDTAARIDELANVVTGDTVEFRLGGKLLYRGEITSRKRTLSDPDKLALSGYGRLLRVGRIIARKRYASAEYGEDVALLFRDLARDWVQPDQPSLVIAAEPLGTNLTAVDAWERKLKDVFDDLTQASGNAGVWGVDAVDDAASADFGKDRLYVHPISSTADYTIMVPGNNVTEASGGQDTADVVNVVHIQGGAPKFPNLLTNGSFEKPVYGGDQGVGNLLLDPGFDTQDHWNFFGTDPSYVKTNDFAGQTYSGDYMLLTDHSGEGASQTVTTGVVQGRDYVLSAHARQQNASFTAQSTGRVTLNWLDSGGNTVSTVTISESVIAPPSSAWEYYETVVRPPANAAGAKVSVQCVALGSNGICWDQVGLVDTTIISQDAWDTVAFGDAKIVAQNWVSQDSHGGGYCLDLSAQASDADGHDLHLEAKNEAKFTVLGGQDVVFQAWFKSPPGVTSNPKMFLEVHTNRTDGSDNPFFLTKYVIPAGSGWADWTPISCTHHFAGDSGYGRAYITFRGSGEVLIDDLCMRDASVYDPANPAAFFIEDGNYEVVLRASDLFAGDPANVLVQQSEATYGARAEIESQSDLTNLIDATNWARAYLLTHALPPVMPTVTLADDLRPFRCGQVVRLAGRDGAALSGGNDLAIARIRRDFSDNKLSTTLELEREQKDLASQVLELVKRTNANSTPGSASGGGGSSSQGGSSPGGGGPAYFGTIAYSDTLPTLHDAYAPANGPHVLAAERTLWNSAITPAAPVAPTAISLVSTLYVGARMDLGFGVQFFGVDPAASFQTTYWQKSLDGGTTWIGPDGTSSTRYPGDIFYLSQNSGALRVRAQTQNPLGAVSAWVSYTSDVAYVAPNADVSGEVIASRTEPTASPLTAGQTYASLKARLDGLLTRIATLYTRTISAGTGLSGGGDLSANRTISLAAATASVIGGVKPGTGISVAADGTLSSSGLIKRRVLMTFYPSSTTADSAPNTSQMARLPRGTGGNVTSWKASGPAVLHTEAGTTTATTFQAFYANSTAAFGAGTAILSSNLSVSGTGRQEATTSTYSAGASSIASDYEISPKWAAQTVAGTYATIQFEEV